MTEPVARAQPVAAEFPVEDEERHSRVEAPMDAVQARQEMPPEHYSQIRAQFPYAGIAGIGAAAQNLKAPYRLAAAPAPFEPVRAAAKQLQAAERQARSTAEPIPQVQPVVPELMLSPEPWLATATHQFPFPSARAMAQKSFD